MSKNLIRNLKLRAIEFSNVEFKQNVHLIHSILRKNQYPTSLVSIIINNNNV